MTHIPDYLEKHVSGYGSMQEEILLVLVKTIERQNAILDDTIHGELKRLADTHDRIENSLDTIAARLGS